MFEPKVYRTNNSESYHLISDEGGSFLYEGRVEYDDGHLYKDEQGRAYYLVTTEIGGNTRYFVEVEPQGIPIPKAEKKEKSISELIMASPRDESPEETLKASPFEPAMRNPEVQEPLPTTQVIAGENTEAAAEATPAEQPDNCFESPDKPLFPTAEPVDPKAEEPPALQPAVTEEAQAAVKALASLPDHKPKKKSRLLTATAAVALILIILAVCAAGTYVYKPGVYTSIKDKLMPTATPTPAPTITPTPTPQATATLTPADDLLLDQPDSALNNIPAVIDGNNSSVLAFINNSSNPYGTSYYSIDRIFDIFDYLNKYWTFTQGNDTPQMVNESIETMNGSAMDYSVLMAAVIQVEGMDARVVAAPNTYTDAYDYYPEVMIATNDDSLSNALMYLKSRYVNLTSIYVQSDGTDYWLSLAPGKTPGQEAESEYAYSVDPAGEIYPVSAGIEKS